VKPGRVKSEVKSKNKLELKIVMIECKAKKKGSSLNLDQEIIIN